MDRGGHASDEGYKPSLPLVTSNWASFPSPRTTPGLDAAHALFGSPEMWAKECHEEYLPDLDTAESNCWISSCTRSTVTRRSFFAS